MGKQKILVTGGCGYIGRFVVQQLIDDDKNVVVVDDLRTCVYRPEWDKEVEVIEKDFGTLTSKDLVDVGEIIHLAASAYVQEGEKCGEKYLANNVDNTVRLLEASALANVGWFTFASSCAVYGDNKGPIDRNTTLIPANFYGITKALCETAVRMYYPTSSKICRLFNVIGASDKHFEWHEPETHILPRILKSMIKGKALDLYDPLSVRCYVDIATVVEELTKHGFSSEIKNVGESNLSLIELVKQAQEVTGKKLTINVCGLRKADPQVIILGEAATKSVTKSIESAWKWEQYKHLKKEEQ